MAALLTASTGIATVEQCQLAGDALRAQRQRLPEVLRDVPLAAWGARSRCAEWNVHQVVRHLCDTTLKATSLLRGASATEVGAMDMDPRTTPLGWMSRSAEETPQATLEVFDTATADLLSALEDRAEGGPADVEWVYGTVPWSVGVLHLFWDAWLHERDILIPLEQRQHSTEAESTAAGIYGLIMAALPILAIGGGFDETVQLTGTGGGSFRLRVDADPEHGRAFSLAGLPAAGTITVTVDRSDTGELSGTLEDVVDFLCGRDSSPPVGPVERVGQLSMLRAFMLAPAT